MPSNRSDKLGGFGDSWDPTDCLTWVKEVSLGLSGTGESGLGHST